MFVSVLLVFFVLYLISYPLFISSLSFVDRFSYFADVDLIIIIS